MTDRLVGDIDIDFPNRSRALEVIPHTPASILKTDRLEKHNTGVYFHRVPVDPLTGFASLSYDMAKHVGWYKMDLLNVGVYEQIRDESHLISLIRSDLDWKLFEYEEFVTKLIHLGSHYDLVSKLKPQNITEISMILALIRPGKKHLIDPCLRYGFDHIKNEIWIEPVDGSYAFKKSHSFGYAMLVKVHANLLVEQATHVD